MTEQYEDLKWVIATLETFTKPDVNLIEECKLKYLALKT